MDTQIIEELSQYGVVEVFSKKQSFVLLMTGEGLDKFATYNAINSIIEPIIHEYPTLQVLKNDDKFFQLVAQKETISN